MEVYPESGPLTTIYRVEDADGNHVADHVREDYPDGTKRCLWRLPDGTYSLNGTKLSELPLYGAQDVAGWDEDALIVLVEGEKARDALAAAGLPALGTVTGAGATPGEAALEVLRGSRVCLWSDNDPQGRKHMERIAEKLQGAAASVLLYEWDGAPGHGDAADHPAIQSRSPKAADKLLTDLEGAPRWEPEPPKSDGRGQSRELHPGFNLTDLGNAERLISRFGDDLRYCHRWDKWLVWDGRRWAEDDCGAVELKAKNTVRYIYAGASAADDSAQRKALADHAKRSESRDRIKAMIDLARSEVGVSVRPDELGADPWALNVLNGTLDLRTGRLRRHDRYDLITKLAPVEYDIRARAPRFERFLEEVFGGDEELIAFVRRFAGYSLTGSTRERALAILHGHSGKNGKSTLVELLRDAMGDYATNTAAETILAKTYQGVGNDVAALKGARFVSAAEIEEGRRLAESKVKNLTGSDTVTARFLYSEPFDFRPEFKLWLSTNNKPIIQGTDDAIWDRIRLVPFTQRFEGDRADPKLPEKLREELPGVLAWMVRGALEWQESGGLGDAAKVRQATAEYREEQDALGGFIEEVCVVNERAKVGATPLYHAYREWCEKNGEKPEKQTKFGTRLKERGFEKKATPRIVYLGIGLRDDRPDPGEYTKQSKGSLNSQGVDNGNCLSTENPIDTRVSGGETKGLNSLKPNIDNFELAIAREERFSKNCLKPFNPLNSPGIDEPMPGEGDFDDLVPDPAPPTPRPVAQPGRRLTEEEVEQVRKLMFEGMSPAAARAEVIGEEKEF